ncbi:hypothetical protein [Micromonospora avicenniae]|uniref:hypothetical protein n=1 Tax=Micromonospora avicenniae TaxID=1198245 RepID=UPI00332D6987
MTTATTTTEVLTTITLRHVFDTITLTLTATHGEALYDFTADADAEGGFRVDVREGTVYRVEAVSIYNTARGGVVGDTREHSFRDLAEARAYANGWFGKLTRKGWERIA